jgi:hypothetical protein
MTAIKSLSAGLIAIAMLATPAMARENNLNHRHVAGEANTVFPGARHVDGRVHMSAPHAPPDGENCDVGDAPFIC